MGTPGTAPPTILHLTDKTLIPTLGDLETIPTPIQTQPELRTFAKKHGFWCRFKSTRSLSVFFDNRTNRASLAEFMCALANNKLPSFPLAI